MLCGESYDFVHFSEKENSSWAEGLGHLVKVTRSIRARTGGRRGHQGLKCVHLTSWSNVLIATASVVPTHQSSPMFPQSWNPTDSSQVHNRECAHLQRPPFPLGCIGQDWISTLC